MSTCAPCAAGVVGPAAGASSPGQCGGGLAFGFPFIEYPHVHLFDHSLLLTSALSPKMGALHLMLGAPLVTLVTINITNGTFEETSRIVSSPQWDAGVYMGSYGIKMCISDDERKLLLAWDASDMRSVVFDNGLFPSNYFDVFGFFNWNGVVSFTCGGLDHRVAPPAPVAFYQFWGENQGIGKKSPALREWLGGSPPVDHWGFSNLVYAPFAGGALFGMHTGWYGSISYGTNFFRVNASTMQVEATGSTIDMWSQYVWHALGNYLVLGSTLTPCDAAATMDPYSLAASPFSCVAARGTLASLVPAIDAAGRLYYITKAGVVLQRIFNVSGLLSSTSALFASSDFSTFVAMQSARLFFNDNQLFVTASLNSTASAAMRLSLRCPVGQTSAANGTCVLCLAGSVSNSSSYFCSFCPPGSYSLVGASACSACAAGKFSDSGASACTTCAAGAYSVAGAPSCGFSVSTCPAGTYASAPASCLPCAAGTFSSGGNALCSSCPAGTFSLDGASLCTDCAAGTYSPSTGASFCSSCALGTYSATGTASCTPCAPGTYSFSAGATSEVFCLSCAAGTYSPVTGANSSETCRPCPAGAYSVKSASTCAFTLGTCPIGTFAKATSSCLSCPPGTYSSSPGAMSSAQCIPCAIGTHSPPSGASSATPCLPCYPATACSVPGLPSQPPCFWNLSTLAGSGAYGRVDGDGTAAAFNSPHGIAFGASLVFVMDMASSTIRTISPSGFVRTLAGAGYAGFMDGQGTAAAFNQPRFIAASSSMVYVADKFNHRVRLVNYSGFVSTLAGDGTLGWMDGAGTNARFSAPHGLTLSNASIFVTDFEGHRIRKVSFSGIVSTFAGSGRMGAYDGQGTSASFRNPTGIAIAPSTATVYVADWNNRIIRTISQSGVVSTLAGSGAASFTDGPRAVASFVHPLNVLFDVSGLYVLDTDAHALRVVSLVPGTVGHVSSIAGSGFSGYANGFGTNALFNYPSSASLGPTGILLVSDFGNNRIRQLTCVPCPESFYCSSGTPILCPAGSYCPFLPPTDNLTPCPAGTWSASRGAFSNATCTRCAAGTYSSVLGATVPSTCVLCPAGTFSMSSGSTAQSMCIPCPAGSYSPAGATSCEYTAASCPVGTFAGATSACTTCSPTTACSVPGLLAQPPCFWNLSTLAGSGSMGWADGQGTAATFNFPVGISVDPTSLSVYVGEYSGHRVRSVSRLGNVSTLAGSGHPWFADGLGTVASFSGLHGVSVDSLGVVYASDSDNNRIRKILPSGMVSTVTNRAIGPTDIALDKNGVMGYIVEQTGSKISRIELSTGTVSTLAGGVAGFADGFGTIAKFNAPTSAVWQASDALFIADGIYNHRIRRINISSTSVVTFAGNGIEGSADGVGILASFSRPRGIAIDPTGSILFVSEEHGHRIRSIDILTALVRTIAGSEARFAGYLDGFGLTASVPSINRPLFIATSPSGDVYFVDWSQRVRQLTCTPCPAAYDCSSGAPVLCAAGSFCPLYSINATPCPAGTWSTSLGATSIATCTSCAAGKYNERTGSTSCTACAAGSHSAVIGAYSSAVCLPCESFYSPAGATSCAYTATTCPVGTYASAPAACTACSPSTACTEPGLTAQPPCFWNVSTLAGSGDAWWADGLGTAAMFSSPHGISFDPFSASLYVGDLSSNRVRRISPTGFVTTLAGSGSSEYADSMGTAAAFRGPAGLSTDPAGSTYVADCYTNRIRKIVPSGMVSSLAGSYAAGGANGIGSAAQFSCPTDIALDSTGSMGFVVEQQGHRIRSIVLFSGSVSTLAGNGFAGFANGAGVAAQFSSPTSLVWHQSGALFVAGGWDNRIRRINISSTVVSTFAGSGAAGGSNGVGTAATFSIPRGVALDAIFSTLYVAEDEGHRIRSIDLSTALVKTIAGLGYGGYSDAFGAALFNRPVMLDSSPSGVLYTVERYNHRVRQLTCVACPAGYDCSSDLPSLCSAGYYCPSSSINAIPCPAGSFSPTGASSCAYTAATCPTGTYASAPSACVTGCATADIFSQANSGAALTVSKLRGCTAHIYYNSGAACNWYGTCNSCKSPNFPETRGFQFQFKTPMGAQTGDAGSVCSTDCVGEAGCWQQGREFVNVTIPMDAETLVLFYGDPIPGDNTGIGVTGCFTVCPPGSYCPNSPSMPLPCPAGSSCLQCATAPLRCEAGSYSGIGAFSCTPCANDTYSVQGAATCAYTASTCPAGTYANGTSACVPCPAGRFSSVTGASTNATCLACPCPSLCVQSGLALAPSCSTTPSSSFSNSSSPTPSVSGTSTSSSSPTPASTVTSSTSPSTTPSSSASPSTSPRLPPGAPCAPGSSTPACATGECRSGFCCSAAAAALGCAACLPGTGSCVLFSPGEPCDSAADCGTNFCAGSCCCAASALQVPGCTACACWANVSTTAATAGICVTTGGSGGSGGSVCNGGDTTINNYYIQHDAHVVVTSGGAPVPSSSSCHACEAFDASKQVEGLFILPGTNPLNPTRGVDLAVGLPGACASLAAAADSEGVPPAEVSVMLPCLSNPINIIIDGVTYVVLGPAAPLRLAVLPEGCSGA